MIEIYWLCWLRFKPANSLAPLGSWKRAHASTALDRIDFSKDHRCVVIVVRSDGLNPLGRVVTVYTCG